MNHRAARAEGRQGPAVQHDLDAARIADGQDEPSVRRPLALSAGREKLLHHARVVDLHADPGRLHGLDDEPLRLGDTQLGVMTGAAGAAGVDPVGVAAGAVSGADSGARTAALGSPTPAGVGWLTSFSTTRPTPKISRSALLIARGWPTHPFGGRARTVRDAPVAGAPRP